jgi:hypothetical protein
MPGSYTQAGTLSINDLLAVNNTSVIDFSREDVIAAVNLYFRMVNEIVNSQLTLFAAKMKKRAWGVGTPQAVTAVYVDEYGVGPAQKAGGVAQMGLPLLKHQIPRQWTNAWMRRHSPADMAMQAQAAAIADQLKLQQGLRTAVFRPTNYTAIDRLVDNMPIYVKGFANADGFPIPVGPSGASFNPNTHSHYVGSANALPTNAELTTLLGNVTEHYTTGDAYLFVNQALGTALTGASHLTNYPDFVPITYQNQTQSTTVIYADGPNITPLNPFNANNRQIGVFLGANVMVKPWVPTSACWAWVDTPDKPLGMRVPDDLGGDNGDFRAVWDDVEFPLECEILEREYGFGIVDRLAGAVLSYGGADSTYVMPTITL